MKKNINFLLFFSGIFVVLSILLYINVPQMRAHLDIDSTAYLKAGKIFYEHNSFFSLGSQPYYSLGYGFLIGIIYKIFGVATWPIIMLQVLLALLCGLLIFVIAQRLFNPIVAKISFIFFSLNIGFLTFSQFILTEITLALLLILFFERFTAFIKYQRWSFLCQAGLVLGTSIIIKPAALYFPYVLVPAIGWFAYTSQKTKFKLVGLFALCFYLPILGYMTHNTITFDKFRIGALQEINMCYWLYPNMLAEKNKTNSDYERKKLQQTLSQQQTMEQFIDFSKKHPLLLAYVWLKNVLKTWVGLFTTNLKVLIDPGVQPGQVSYFKMQGSWWQKAFRYVQAGTNITWLKIVGFLEASWSILRLILVLIALLYLLQVKKYALLYLFCSYLGYFSMITGHDGCARFRMMFEFLLIILAAVGLWIIFKTRKRSLP